MGVFDLILMSYDELVRWNSRRTSGCRAFCSGQPFPVPEAVSNWLGRISTLTKIVRFSFYFRKRCVRRHRVECVLGEALLRCGPHQAVRRIVTETSGFRRISASPARYG